MEGGTLPSGKGTEGHKRCAKGRPAKRTLGKGTEDEI